MGPLASVITGMPGYSARAIELRSVSEVRPGEEIVTTSELESLGMSARICHILRRYDIYTLEQLAASTEEDLLIMRNFGESSLAEVRAILMSKGLDLTLRSMVQTDSKRKRGTR